MKAKLSFIIFTILLFICASEGFAQDKQLWAKSFINKKAPDLNLQTWLTEKPNTEGKFILLDFWATWCGPCKKGIPDMNKFSEKFKEDLVVIGVTKESEAKVKQMKKPVMKYYSALDSAGELNSKFEIQGIPHAVLIDSAGYVRWEGFPTLRNEQLTSSVISKIIESYK